MLFCHSLEKGGRYLVIPTFPDFTFKFNNLYLLFKLFLNTFSFIYYKTLSFLFLIENIMKMSGVK